jgi:hypothetical protein
MGSSVKDPHYIDADPHPGFIFDADPDPIFYYTSHSDADPDAVLHQRVQICNYWPINFP